ncbi:MAG: MFS transporter [Gemmatimonadetes bacterium]|nr:MFS transporter [Gemmatimonadota bacterium]
MSADLYSTRWRVLTLLAFSELLGMSLWFPASAVTPQLRSIWGLTTAQAGWLTTIVQLGFVCGTAMAALLNLADLVPAGRLFSASALLGSISNAAILASPGYRTALACRFLTGFFLAGVYPPAMKMVATWFRSERGLAIGVIVGALTVGKATPYLVRAFPHVGLRPVVLTSSLGALIAAGIVGFTYRDGPHPFASRPFSWHQVRDVVRIREWRLATGSYLGHMFELYAFWTWIPSFLAASCLLSGVLFGGPPWVLGALAMTWGFFVIADSAQFSTLVTESVPAHTVGTALTIQTSLGFLLTMLPMQLVPLIAERVGWRWAFAVLAVGPLAGIAAIRRFAAVRRAPVRAASLGLSA